MPNNITALDNLITNYSSQLPPTRIQQWRLQQNNQIQYVWAQLSQIGYFNCIVCRRLLANSYCKVAKDEMYICAGCVEYCEVCGGAYSRRLGYYGDAHTNNQLRRCANPDCNRPGVIANHSIHSAAVTAAIHLMNEVNSNPVVPEHERPTCLVCRSYNRELMDVRTDFGTIGTINERTQQICEHCNNMYIWCVQHYRFEYRNDTQSCPNRIIGGHNSNPALKFHLFTPFGEKISPVVIPGEVFLGMELECESHYADLYGGARIIHAGLEKYAWMKTDGSLNNGFEICTHPMTLEYFKSVDWSAFGELLKFGFHAWNASTAGIHVHVGRSAFKSDSHLWKFGEMIVMNPEKVQKFAGRGANGYNTYNGMVRKVSDTVLKKPEANPGHYDAVNLSNANTVEVRIFRSSLRIRRILANLEFVDACVRYTEDLTIPMIRNGALKWRSFRKWINEQKPGLYDELLSFVDNGKED